MDLDTLHSSRRRQHRGLWSAVLAAAAVSAAAPYFVEFYILGLLTQAFCLAMLVITVDLLWGYTGILSLGQSAFFGIGAYSVGIIFSHVTGDWPGAGLGMAAGIAVATFVAGALGWFTFYARTSLIFPFYVSVVTLATGVVFYQIVLSGGTLTGSSQGLSGFQTLRLSPTIWYWCLLALLLLFTYGAYRLVSSDTGVLLVAIRENEERLRYLGYDTPRIKTLLFTACAALAAVSGGLYALYSAIVAPSLVSYSLGTDAVIWTALGGRGTLIGPILGAVTVNVIGPALNASFPFIWQLLLGTLFVVVVTAAPAGLLPPLWSGSVRIFRRVMGTGSLPKHLPVATTIRSAKANPLPKASVGSGPVLKIENLERSYGSLSVLKDINLSADRGELVSIVGPNGAGKTTLIKCIADGAERSSGLVYVNSHEIGNRQPQSVVALGVGRKFQTADVFTNLAVSDCLRLASWRGRPPSWLRRSAELELPEAAMMVIQATRLIDHMDTASGNLSHGMRQALELAMVLALRPSVLLLDEPTAGLTKEERSKISEVLSALRRSKEMALILIEHDFEFVKEISSRMVVLHQGQVVLDGTVEEVSNSEIVRSIYLGHAGELRA